ncbi:putative calpain-like cysteine peptidase [Trypanosoma cruzi]|uniref:Putative calpain-like cysteine peptidase n=1 Tax=Trypanosoma cruzi TaxID=5693 RepID=A0A2V2VMB1_TRYCR|nr:putative calpain-like cysteine peptidase [Trypanosoma cruzi]
MGNGGSSTKRKSGNNNIVTTHFNGGDASLTTSASLKGILKNGDETKTNGKNNTNPLQGQQRSVLASPFRPASAAELLPATYNGNLFHGTGTSRQIVGLIDHYNLSSTVEKNLPARMYNSQWRGCVRFKNGSPLPLRGGDDVIPIPLCTDGGGGVVFCYRIISVDGRLWSFYNDTVTYELEVVCVFSANSKIEALGLTTLRERSDGRAEMRLVLHPGDTQEFIYGDVERYEEDIRLRHVSRAFIDASARACEPFLKDERASICALLSRRGKKTGPGNNWNVPSEELLRWCVEEQVPFLDLEFPPNLFSLVGKEQSTQKKVLCGWCKPKNYIPTEALVDEPRVLRSSPQPMTVGVSLTGGQGVVGALAILAEDYFAVERLFRHPMGSAAAVEEERVDASRVTLCKGGWWISTVVDHYFPVLNMKLLTGKCISDPAELWVSVVEKAYAKLHGNYTNLAETDALQALQELTGFPTSRWDFMLRDASSHEELFDKLCRFCELGFIVVLDRPNLTSGKSSLQRLGLQEGNACVVLSMKMFQPLPSNGVSGQLQQQGIHRLVRVRNPFGSARDWVGDWNLWDPAWKTNPLIAAQCGHDKECAEDGSFWMEWRDVVCCFHGCGACFTHNLFYEYRVAGQCGKGGIPGCVIKLEVSRRMYILGMLQQEVRGVEGMLQPILLQLSRRYVPKATQMPSFVDALHNEANTKSQQSLKRSDARKQEVVLNSTADCDRPSPDLLTFRASSQVSFICELLPEYSPYYLIPRTTSDDMAYVLGLFTSVPCGRGSVGDGAPATRSAPGLSTPLPTAGGSFAQAKFMRLSSKTRVFSNSLRFEVKSEKPVKCRYQVSSPTASPLTFPSMFTDNCIR